MQSQHQSLSRVLGLWMATAIVVGTVIGSGVFKKARNVAVDVPEFGLAMGVWVLGGVLALLGALALAEVAVLYPKAGGNYVFLREAYGRGFGFLWGWVEFWIIRSASIAALAAMFSDSVHDVLRHALYPGQSVIVLSFWAKQLLTVLVIAGLAHVNARGTRLGGKLQVIVTTVKVGSLLFIIVLPFAILAAVSEPAHPPRVEYLQPTWPVTWLDINWGAFGAALVGVLWAYHGWMNIAPVAEEVRNPSRNIPLALLGGVMLLIILYCSVNTAYYLVIPHAEMAAFPSGTTVSTEFFLRLLGPIGAVLGAAIVMTSVFGSLNGNLLVGPRLLFAMGKDGLAPPRLQELHPKYQTPFLATALLAGWACLLVLVTGLLTQFQLPSFQIVGSTLDLNVVKKEPFDLLTNFAIFGAVSFETLAVASIFVFRRRFPPTLENRPYRCPGYPLVPIAYILIMAAVLANMFINPEHRPEATIGLGFIAAGVVVYMVLFSGNRRM